MEDELYNEIKLLKEQRKSLEKALGLAKKNIEQLKQVIDRYDAREAKRFVADTLMELYNRYDWYDEDFDIEKFRHSATIVANILYDEC